MNLFDAMPLWFQVASWLLLALCFAELFRSSFQNRRTLFNWTNLRWWLLKNLRRPATYVISLLLILSGWGLVRLLDAATAGVISERRSAAVQKRIVDEVANVSIAMLHDPKAANDLLEGSERGSRSLFVLSQAKKLSEVEAHFDDLIPLQRRTLLIERTDADLVIGDSFQKTSKTWVARFDPNTPDSVIRLIFGARPFTTLTKLNPRVTIKCGNDVWRFAAANLAPYLRKDADGSVRHAEAAEPTQVIILDIPALRSSIGQRKFTLSLDFVWRGFEPSDPQTVVAISPGIQPGRCRHYSYRVAFDRPLILEGFVSLHNKTRSAKEPDFFRYEMKDGLPAVAFDYKNLDQDVAFIFERSDDRDAHQPAAAR